MRRKTGFRSAVPPTGGSQNINPSPSFHIATSLSTVPRRILRATSCGRDRSRPGQAPEHTTRWGERSERTRRAEREREADKDLAAGRVTHFESDEDFLAELDERTKPLDADT